MENYEEKDYVNTDGVIGGDKPFFVRSPYNYDMAEVSDDTGLDCSVLPSRTQQSFTEECDINTIVKRFKLTGQMPTNLPQIMQGDFEGVHDFQSAMDMVVAAREAFMTLPHEVRTRFDNDPHKFLEFTSDERNFDEAAKLGLVRTEVLEARAKAVEERRVAEIEKAVQARLSAQAKP